MTKLPLEQEFMCTPLHEHPLQQVDSRTVYPQYGGEWKCDNCGTSYDFSHHPFHCSQCYFDLCHVCASVYTNNIKEFMHTPLHEHPLQQVDPRTVYGGRGFNCDNCGRDYDSSHHPFHCSLCNFDLCHFCASVPALVNTNNIRGYKTREQSNPINTNTKRTMETEHGLQQVHPLTVYGGRGFNCDNCGRDYDSSHHPFHCSLCNFDLCHICASVYTNNIKEKQTSPAVKQQGVVSVDGARPSASQPPSTSGPEVFISYQWGSQDVVLELKQRLEKNGIRCWMDTSQMGGGDALFKEIDAGISASKVVICCVTQKYCQSENCQREATLADSRKKPIIPLLFEDITWPPTGQLALVFAKLLYIKMVPCLEAVHSNKFQEILQKIQGHISK